MSERLSPEENKIEVINKLYAEVDTLKQQLQKVIAERDTWRQEVLNGIYQSARQNLQQEMMQKINAQKGVESLKETK